MTIIFYPSSLLGATGPIGPTGPAGADGIVQFRFGTGAPSNALGNDSDVYEDTANGDFYLKVSGAWVLKDNLTGPQGPQGVPGATILNGTVDPTTEGVDGDFYLNTVTTVLWGPKTGGVWL